MLGIDAFTFDLGCQPVKTEKYRRPVLLKTKLQYPGKEEELIGEKAVFGKSCDTVLLNPFQRAFMCWQHAGEEVRLSWSDGHVSPYPLTWLFNRSFRFFLPSTSLRKIKFCCL
jgi:hypothetical protein